MIDLCGATAAVADWSTDRYVNDCASVYDDTWIRGIDISPGQQVLRRQHDRAPSSATSPCVTRPPGGSCRRRDRRRSEPTWIDHTGGDTHWAVAHHRGRGVSSVVTSGGPTTPTPPGGDNDGPARSPVPASPRSTHTPASRSRGTRPATAAAASRPSHATPDHLFVGSDTSSSPASVRQRLRRAADTGGLANPAPEKSTLPGQLASEHRRRLYNTDASTAQPSRPPGQRPLQDGVNWNGVRDGFVQHEQLVYYGPAGVLLRRSMTQPTRRHGDEPVDSVGYVDTDLNLTPYDQPVRRGRDVAAAYTRARIYYTKIEQTHACSGAGTRSRAASRRPGVPVLRGQLLPTARTMEVAGNRLYVVK